jgi:arabinofuranan 3-O-arabinosyltransferase
VTIPGVTVTRYLKPAQVRAGEMAAATAFSFEQLVPSPASLANVAAYPPLARTFTTPAGGAFHLGASAIAVPGSALDAVLTSLTPVRGNTLEVTASSTYGSLPGLAPANLFRRDHAGPWIAGGQHAALRLSWPGERTIRQLVLQPLPGFAAAPEAVKINSPQGIRYASVGLGGLTQIVPPLKTSQMTISFPVVQFATTAQPISGQPVRLPVGLSKLSIPALRGLQPATLAPAAKFSLPCGSGPAVTLDGQVLRTRVFGKLGSLIAFQPVHVRLCRTSSQVELAVGRHWLAAARPGAFTMTGLSLISAGSLGQPASGGPGAQALQDQDSHGAWASASSLPGRSVKVLTWDPEYRRVRIARGPASYLELHQNANPGWSATLGGRQLTPATLDGWQQGFIVPAGTGGVVTLTFRPAKFYHVWIILSAAGALGLLLAAIAGLRRRSVPEQMDRASQAGRAQVSLGPPGRVPAGIGATGAGLAGLGSTGTGPAGLAAGEGWSVWVGLVALAVLMAIIGGPMVAAVPVVALLAYRWPGWYGGLAASAMVAAGVFTSLAAHPALPGTGAFGAPAQACALVALACALMPVLPERRPGTGSRS